MSEGSAPNLNEQQEKTPEKFATDNVWVSSKFREEALSRGFAVIDTSLLTPADVAQKVAEYIHNLKTATINSVGCI